MLRFATFLSLSLFSCFASTAEIPGLVKEKPAEGPYVKTDRGYMVPYTAKIPGTDVAYEMVPIPGGKVAVGSPDLEKGRDRSEGPQFTVTVEPFWMGKYEVMWKQYKPFMGLYEVFKRFEKADPKIRPVTEKSKVDAVTAPTPLYEPSFTFEHGERPKLPAVTMTHYAARQYTKWLSRTTGRFYRLPTEAEWEYACRGGAKTAYHFGDDPAKLKEYGWYAGNSEEKPHEVGQLKPNQFGLYDMHGNAAEWVLDMALKDGFKKFGGKTVKLWDAVVWPLTEENRVIKGGSFEFTAAECRCASRLTSEPEDWKAEDPNLPLSPWWFTSDPARGVGMRVVRTLDEPADVIKARIWEADAQLVKDAIKDRINEGRGVYGLVDEKLPDAIKKLDEE